MDTAADHFVSRTRKLRAVTRVLHACRRSSGLWSTLWLIACLLLAQQSGLIHRVTHGALTAPLQLASPTPASTIDATLAADTAAGPAFQHHDSGLASHSCVLFDGAAVADILSAVPLMPALAHAAPTVPATLTWQWPNVPAMRTFLSRAPPPMAALARSSDRDVA